MNISAPFIKRPVGTSLLAAALLMAGALAFRFLPVAPLPQVEYPVIQVSGGLPGASPETMASTVATPLEREFSTIAGVSSMSSANTQGSTSITVQFSLDRNIDAAAQDIQAHISAAGGRLPSQIRSA
jgi:multidrug efflux pump subunit AcrB